MCGLRLLAQSRELLPWMPVELVVLWGLVVGLGYIPSVENWSYFVSVKCTGMSQHPAIRVLNELIREVTLAGGALHANIMR